MHRTLKSCIRLILSLVVTTFICTVVWEKVVANKLYDCTDAGWLDYLSPGDWVHKPVMANHIVHGRSMSESDTIKQGWSVAGLWSLWFVFALVSTTASVAMAFPAWTPFKDHTEDSGSISA